jgi:hypothetical protein
MFNSRGLVYTTNTGLFQSFNFNNVTLYDIIGTAIDTGGGAASIWEFDIPNDIPADLYYWKFYDDTVASWPPTTNIPDQNYELRWEGEATQQIERPVIHHADIHYMYDSVSNEDKYTAIWYRNAEMIPTYPVFNTFITVINYDTGSTLINNQAMSYIAGTGFSTVQGDEALKYTETSNLQTQGVPYLVTVSASLDGATRTFQKTVGYGDQKQARSGRYS